MDEARDRLRKMGNNPAKDVQSERKQSRVLKPRGFATMSPERRKRIAALGGKSLKPEQRSFYTNRELAAACGRLGGEVAPRRFDRDPELARRAFLKSGWNKHRKLVK